MTKLIPEKLVFSEEEIDQVMSMAACNFSPELIAKRFNVHQDSFMKIWYDTETDLRQAYDAGKLSSQHNIMEKQRELAESGNITSAQVFLKESKEIEITNIRNLCLFG